MAQRAPKIYVQIDIRGPIDRVWALTQTPDLHQRWDLRFTEISYLPRPNLAQPQRFLYATRIGFGVNIRGEGESVGECDEPTGERSSALRFWSADPKSLIRQGSGYWKYIPSDGDEPAVRFLTLYDYEVRFGLAGRWFDRLIFRPLMGWATAWSFDRLRLWIERGIDPVVSMRLSLAYLAARLTLVFIWAYQGIVPKLITHHPDELEMLRAMGVSAASSRVLCGAIGCLEVALGLVLVLGWRWLWPLRVTLIAMPVALLAVALKSPQFLRAPFNPVTLNIAVFALAGICLLLTRDLASACRCVRQLPKGEA